MNLAVTDFDSVSMSPGLAATLARASDAAAAMGAGEVALEHLLQALCDDPDALAVLDASRVDINRLKPEIGAYLARGAAPPSPPGDLTVSQELRRILEAAAAAARGGKRRDINGAIVLAAIVGDGRSIAAQMLQAYGLTFDEAIRALQSALNQPAPRDFPAYPAAADDVLARARERVQSRATPTLRDIMKDQPRPAPPPPMPFSTTEVPSVKPYENKTEPAPIPDALKPTLSAPSIADRPPSGEVGGQIPAPVATDTGPLPSAPAPIAPSPAHAPEPLGGGYVYPASAPPPMQSPRAETAKATRPSPVAGSLTEYVQNRAPSTVMPPPIPPPMPGAAGRPAGASLPWPPVGMPAPYTGQQQPQFGAPGPRIGAPAAYGPQPSVSTAPAPAQKPQPPAAAKRGAVNKAETGQMAENIPRSMRVGKTERVEIRVAKAAAKAIIHGLEGGGVVWKHEITVTQAMSVRLRAPEGGFFIETASPETQWVESQPGFASDDFANWRFLVTPQSRGWARLQIIVSARTVGADGMTAETAMPDQIVEVKVRTNFKRTLARWTGWITAAVAGGALAKFGETGIALVNDYVQQILATKL